MWDTSLAEGRKGGLSLDKLAAHLDDHLNTGEIYAEVVNQPTDKTDLLNIVIAKETDIPLATLWPNKATALVHTQTLLVHPGELSCHANGVAALLADAFDHSG
jgi:hypothetical protein